MHKVLVSIPSTHKKQLSEVMEAQQKFLFFQKKKTKAASAVAHAVILATQKADIRTIMVRGQPG
jgi:membrane-bound lytic murein transglycosylase